MADPELRSDEKVLLRTQGVYVKSIPFEGILTNKRIILVDRAKNLLPPKEIPLVTIKEAEAGENAIRDQIITLSVLAKTGETRQMILTFSRQTGGNRIKERDAWERIIKENASPSGSQIIRKVIPEPETVIRKSEPVARPRYEVVHSPVRQATPVRESPVRKQSTPIPSAPSSPATVSYTPAPPTVLCSKCGGRVPAESVFCNRCGSPIAGIRPAPAPEPAPAVRVEPAPAPVQVLPEATIEAPGAVQVPTAPVVVKMPSARPIDEEIRSIEPLIERSTENIPNDALRAEPVKNPFEEPAWHAGEPEHTATEKPVEMEPVREIPPPNPVSEAVPPVAPSYGSPSDTPPPPKPPRGGNFLPGKNTLVTGAVALIAILIVAAGAFFVLPMLSGGEPGTGEVTTVPTTSASATPSTTATIKEKPAMVIPKTGVQVHVNYLGGFKGSYGMPAMLTSVPGNSGERVWEVENANGTVQATFEKLDGSSHELVVEIYKDGKLLTSGSTTVGHGSVALSVDTTTGIAAPPVSSGGGSASRTTAAVVATTTRRVTTAAGATVTTTTAAP